MQRLPLTPYYRLVQINILYILYLLLSLHLLFTHMITLQAEQLPIRTDAPITPLNDLAHRQIGKEAIHALL
jgi:hypothetical protein